MGWPGQQQGYTTPVDAFFSSVQRTGIYNDYAGPAYTGPGNISAFGGAPQVSMLAQLALPSILQMTMGQQMTPFQMVPQQSVYDQLLANDAYRQQQIAMSRAARRDVTGMSALLGGITQTMTKKPLTQVQAARNQRVAEGVQGMMPLLIQALGPDLIDRLHGSQGSAGVMAQQLQQALRTQRDPVTGRRGFTGDSTGASTESIFEHLYGTGSNLATMRGMSAGQAGILTNELQQRGLLGPLSGAIPLEERRAALPEVLSEGTVSRIAEKTPMQRLAATPGGSPRTLQDLREANEEITTEMLETAREQVRSSLRQMKGMAPAVSNRELIELFGADDQTVLDQRRKSLASGLNNTDRAVLIDTIRVTSDGKSLRDLRDDGVTASPELERSARMRVDQLESRAQRDMTRQDIEQMPGGEEILRATDAQRISSRLKNLSGAVAAMREIFGDMGNPNAPMRELINGLEALTQGGLSTMSAGQLEHVVRRTQAITNQTGVGVSSQLGMVAQNAQLADRLGLDRTFATRATQQGLVFGQALADTQRLDIPVWGARSREEMVLADQQLRMYAAASPMANQLSALMRMQERGLLGAAGPGSELASLIAAVSTHQLDYTFTDPNTGKKVLRPVDMSRERFQTMLERDAGISKTESMAAIMDRRSNQEMIGMYNIDNLARRQQTRDSASRFFAPSLGGRTGSLFRDTGVDETLSALGVTANDQDFRKFVTEIGHGVSKDFFTKLTQEEMRDETKRPAALGRLFRGQVRDAVRRRMPDADEATIEQLISAAVDQLGGEQGLARAGSLIHDTINQAAGRHPLLGSAQGAYDVLSPAAAEAYLRNENDIAAEAMTREALGGLGTTGMIENIVDAFRQAGPATPFREVLGKALGGISLAELSQRDPSGAVAALLGMKNEQIDPNSPGGLAKIRRNAQLMRGLVEGGDAAKSLLATLSDEERVKYEEALTKAAAGESVTSLMTASQERANLLYTSHEAITTNDFEGAASGIKKMLNDRTIDMGDGRKMTKEGIFSYDKKGRVIKREGFDTVETLREAWDALSRDHQEAGDADDIGTSAKSTTKQTLSGVTNTKTEHTATAATGQDKQLKVTISGTLQEKENNTFDLAGWGQGIYENLFGTVG